MATKQKVNTQLKYIWVVESSFDHGKTWTVTQAFPMKKLAKIKLDEYNKENERYVNDGEHICRRIRKYEPAKKPSPQCGKCGQDCPRCPKEFNMEALNRAVEIVSKWPANRQAMLGNPNRGEFKRSKDKK